MLAGLLCGLRPVALHSHIVILRRDTRQHRRRGLVELLWLRGYR